MGREGWEGKCSLIQDPHWGNWNLRDLEIVGSFRVGWGEGIQDTIFSAANFDVEKDMPMDAHTITPMDTHTTTPIVEETLSQYGKKDVLVISKGISQEESQEESKESRGQSCESVMQMMQTVLNVLCLFQCKRRTSFPGTRRPGHSGRPENRSCRTPGSWGMESASSSCMPQILTILTSPCWQRTSGS